jgi:glycosidase
MYIPLGSHDTERIFSVFGGQMEKVKLAFFFQFSSPGAPSIYYGDEIGVEGGKDPDCRRAFPWDPAQWKADLQPWVRSLVDVRKQRISLRRGEMVRLMTHDDDRVYAFARVLGDEKTVTVLNVSGHKRDVQLPVPTLGLGEGRVLRSLLDNRPFVVTDGRLNITLEPWSGMWLG